VITNSSFTKSAKELAQRAGIRLIDGRDLSRFSAFCAATVRDGAE
jgi:HJR/Mrr/RecB family endonuclease